MKRRIHKLLALTLCAAILMSCICAGAIATGDDRSEKLLETMTTRDKIAQMILPAFRYWPDEAGELQNVTELSEEIAGCISRNGFGGVILFSSNTGETETAVRLVDAIQRANASVSGRPQLLMAIDQEGGLVTRLGQGTQMPGNMALGAANSENLTADAARIIGTELSAMGIHMNFGPVVDVNSNPSNPVIGLRSFSDAPKVVAAHGTAYLKAQNETGVISAIKHFPGHGDVATDSHTGLPSEEDTYEELKASALIPFQAGIDAGAEVIMTAHIQYPNIEHETYPSISTGQEIPLPATLSKTILTDILRGDMGYEGVIVSDAMEMDAIAAHFAPMDAARLAIEAGVDLILMPVDTSSREGIAALEQYIDQLATQVEEGVIPSEKVDAAVLRILKLKDRHGLLDPYQSGDLDQRVEQAMETVGSPAHHAREWEIAKRAVTLVKNQNCVLPIQDGSGKTVVLTAYDNEILGLEYAVRRLREEGKLSENAEVPVYSYQSLSAEELLPLIEDASHVIMVSELYREANLDPANGGACVKIDAVIRASHMRQVDVSILSANLPYDAARYPDADAIVVAWSARGMSQAPGDAEHVAEYGPNLPAALYLMLCPDETPTGILPVDIPALDENYRYSEETLYARGWGLRYRGVFCQGGDDCPLKNYVDTDENAWYHDGIHYVLERGIMEGYGKGRFGTADSATRAMIVTMLWRMEGEPEAEPVPFRDVPEKSWYAKAVSWAASQGIADGYSDSQFGPEDEITREQLAAILYRYAAYLGTNMAMDDSADLTGYQDYDQISPWALDALSWACGKGFLRGTSDSALSPGKSASRAEVATVLLRWELRELEPWDYGELEETWKASYLYSPVVSAGAGEVYAYLRHLGLNEAVSCGILSNMEFESGFVLTALGDGGTSYGLCQWHDERWRRLDEYCQAMDYAPDSLQGQMEYLLWELQNYETTTWELLQSIPNDVEGAVMAAEIWCRTYERPRDLEGRNAVQSQCAREKYWPAFGQEDQRLPLEFDENNHYIGVGAAPEPEADLVSEPVSEPEAEPEVAPEPEWEAP